MGSSGNAFLYINRSFSVSASVMGIQVTHLCFLVMIGIVYMSHFVGGSWLSVIRKIAYLL